MKNPFRGTNDETNDINKEESFENNEMQNEASDEKLKYDEEKVATENIETENEEKIEAEQHLENQENEAADKLQEKYDQLNNQYIRLAADFDNFRKRQEQEKEALLKYGAESTLKKMLEVLDNFERGKKAIETVEECDKVKECFNLTYKNFTDVLKKAGLEEINAEGVEFDPNFHEAVMQTPTSEKPEHTIIAELQKGYKLGNKVLRPSLVNVAVSE